MGGKGRPQGFTIVSYVARAWRFGEITFTPAWPVL